MAADANQIDVVFLLPGFLGFERLRDYTYFADRFGTALRAALTPRVAQPFTVMPVPLPPTSSLADRQLALGKTLVQRAQDAARTRGAAGVRGIHLVGHSTGGVDAHLLTLERPLTARTWRDFDGVDVTWLRQRLRSVISLASPHQGTCLADDAIAQLIAVDSPIELLHDPAEKLETVVSAAREIFGSVPDLLKDEELQTLLEGIRTPAGWTFLGDILRSRALIEDLTPARSVDRYTQLGAALPNVLRRSFVTLAGVTPDANKNAVQSAKMRAPDPPPSGFAPKFAPPGNLFLVLAQLTSGRNTECFVRAPLRPGSLDALEAVRSDPARVITADPRLVPLRADRALNDGVVNASRQMIEPLDPKELVALVIADHFDVVGHYDRAVYVTDPRTGKAESKEELSGLLHSGSRFRDDQFFELIDRMAVTLQPAFD